MRDNKGYTLDQTIVIIAAIAILITLIVFTIGWGIVTRAHGSKIVEVLRQIDEANTTFFATTNFWPTTAVANFSTAAGANIAGFSAAILKDITLLDNGPPASITDNAQDYLTGMRLNAAGLRLTHEIGGGGNIFQFNVADANTISPSANIGDRRLIIVMDNVPFSEAREADELADSVYDPDTGKMVLRDSGGTDCTATAAIAGEPRVVMICYLANVLN